MLTFRRAGRQALARGLAAVLLLALGSGCSHKEDPPIDFGDNDPSVVLAMGDSITFGIFDMGVDYCSESDRTTLGYCPRLQALTGKTVINEGVCGELSSSGVWRLGSELRRWRPGVVLIDYSPNDVSIGSDATIRNLRAMIAEARANKTIPILGTLAPATGIHSSWDDFAVELNHKIRALCVEENVECADHYKAFSEDPGFKESPYALLSEDGLHPNGAGYALMARTWREPLLRVY